MNTRPDKGFTNSIELLIVVAIISIIAAIAVPGLLRARMTGNETSAIASLKVTTSSQVAYSASCGNGGYAATYIILGTPIMAGGEPFISADLGLSATPQKSGYNFTMTAGAAGAGRTTASGRATNAATTGRRCRRPTASGHARVRRERRQHGLAGQRRGAADRAVRRAGDADPQRRR